jgi:hypothetical protein
MLTVYPSQVYADSTGALVVFTGPANRAVAWSLTGPGTLTPLTDHTDDQGRAAATYVPAGAGSATIQATYGT